ncbi:MAG: hypothetical protein ISP68_04735 [Flavobacteriaceae bacterium]|jgi:hypothetical protein|nr:hypothetical protein [Flavobacteriaceae bacterium]
MNQEENTFYQFINPVCLALGIFGFCLYFEVDYLTMGMTGIGLWGVTGLLHMDKKRRIK